MLQSRTKKLLYLNNKINNQRHHKISEVTELSVTVVYYYDFYFMNIRGVIYWEFFFTVMGDFETSISKQKNSKETLKH